MAWDFKIYISTCIWNETRSNVSARAYQRINDTEGLTSLEIRTHFIYLNTKSCQKSLGQSDFVYEIKSGMRPLESLALS